VLTCSRTTDLALVADAITEVDTFNDTRPNAQCRSWMMDPLLAPLLKAPRRATQKALEKIAATVTEACAPLHDGRFFEFGFLDLDDPFQAAVHQYCTSVHPHLVTWKTVLHYADIHYVANAFDTSQFPRWASVVTSGQPLLALLELLNVIKVFNHDSADEGYKSSILTMAVTAALGRLCVPSVVSVGNGHKHVLARLVWKEAMKENPVFSVAAYTNAFVTSLPS
jgi:hypothetical protein